MLNAGLTEHPNSNRLGNHAAHGLDVREDFYSDNLINVYMQGCLIIDF